MAVDWRKEWDLTKRIWRWWMFTGLLTIPFGIIYALVSLRIGHESTTAMVICLAAAILVNYKVQGMPPDK